MFGLSRGPKGPQFSRHDVQTLVERTLPRVQQQLGQPVYLTNDRSALVTEAELVASVRAALETESRNLTGESLATQLDVPRTLVEQLLPRAAEGLSGVYIDSVLILPQPRVEQVVAAFASNETEILRVRDLCARENLTIKSLDYVVRHSKGQLVLAAQGEYIVSASTLDKHVTRVKSVLDAATKPTRLSAVEPDPVLRELVRSALGLGDDLYTPQSYIDAQLGTAISALNEIGYISLADLAACQIKDVPRFARRQNAVLLRDYVVSSAFYDEQKDRVAKALAEHRYFDLRDLPLGKRVADALIADDKTKLAKYYKREAYPHHLVKPSLERDLTAKISKALEPDAQAAAAAVPIEASGSTTADALLNKVELPNSSDIAKRFLEDLPEDLPVASRIAPQIRGAYSAAALAVLKQRVEEAVERLDAKILAYLNAVKTISNAEVRAQVWDEWQQYVSENEYSVPGNEQEAANQFQAKPAYIAEAAEAVRSRTEARLSKLTKAKDAALVLHLAVVVYHARNFVPEKNGILKIRGKLVPKLLKEFTFPESFNALKKAIKAPTGELLEQVKKDAAVQA